MASSYDFESKNLAELSLRTWCNVVFGKMSSIDRRKKFVTVDNKLGNNGSKIPYDHLILATGTQYQIPVPTELPVDTQR